MAGRRRRRALGRPRRDLEVSFSASITPLLGRPDNVADRELVRALVNSLAVRTNPADRVDVEGVLEDVAPLGLKKKLTAYDTSNDPRLDLSGLPRYRKVHAADEALVLEDLGEVLFARMPVGPVAREVAHEVLNEAVAYYFERLKNELPASAPTGSLSGWWRKTRRSSRTERIASSLFPRNCTASQRRRTPSSGYARRSRSKLGQR